MHAHTQGLLIAGTEALVPDVLAFLETREVSLADKQVLVYPDMGVDHARRIREDAALHGIAGPRVFIVVATNITTEAQNALLKTLEEPLGGAVFVLVVPAPDMLLPTVCSRLQRIVLPGSESVSPVDPMAFLAAPPATRIEMLKVLTGADEKDTAGTIAFLSALETILAKRPAASAREGITALYRARAYILDKGALRKALLEQVALLA